MRNILIFFKKITQRPSETAAQDMWNKEAREHSHTLASSSQPSWYSTLGKAFAKPFIATGRYVSGGLSHIIASHSNQVVIPRRKGRPPQHRGDSCTSKSIICRLGGRRRPSSSSPFSDMRQTTRRNSPQRRKGCFSNFFTNLNPKRALARLEQKVLQGCIEESYVSPNAKVHYYCG